MEEKPFRVLLDFTELNLNSSYLKYVWMNVCPRKLRTVEDLKNTILTKYPFIQENVKLFLLDGLLPEKERIFILRENDTVKLQVKYSKQSLEEFSPSCNNFESNHNDYLEETSSRSSRKSKESKKRKNDTHLTSYHDNSIENPSKRKKSSTRNPKFFEPVLINISSSGAAEEEQTNVPLATQNFHRACEDESVMSHDSENSTKKKKKDKSAKISKSYEPDLVNVSSSVSFVDEHVNVLDTRHNSEVFHENESDKLHIIKKQKKRNSKSSISRMSTCDFLTYAALSGLENTSESVGKSNLNVSVNESISDQTGSNDVSSKITIDESVNGQNIDVGIKKCKRKRKRKRKPISCLTGSIETSIDEGSFETSANSINKDYSSNTPKHVLYCSPTSPNMSESVMVASNSNTIYIKSSLDEENNVENFNSTSLENKLLKDTYTNIESSCHVSFLKETDSPSKVSTPYSWKMLKTKPWEITPMPKTSYTDSNTFSVKELDNFEKERKIKKVYDDCPSLNSVPPVGTHLAYKILELGENYCPEVTNFKEGILKSIDPETDELEIELIEVEVKPGRKGKFELLKEDEIPPNQVIKNVHLKWKDLIDPRLVN